MRWYYIILMAISTVFIQCNENESNATGVIEDAVRDTSITPQNSFTQLFLDSAVVEDFLNKHNLDDSTATKIRNFYKNRNYQYAWFTSDGLAEQTQAFWNLHQQYVNYSKDSAVHDKQLHQQIVALLDNDAAINPQDEKIKNIELELTEHFFDFAKYAYTGSVDPEDMQWHIPRKKVDAVALLDSLINKKGKGLEDWEPVNTQYRLMKNELLRYYDIEKNHQFSNISLGDAKILKNGDSSAVVVDLKNRIRVLGDISSENNTPLFDSEMENAVLNFQERHGLKQDGVIGPATMKFLNMPVKERIEQLLVNMERMRWMPEQSDGRRLVANIPEFKLHVYEGNNKVMSMDIVVGKAGTSTVIFSDQLEHIVFSPYWNVPVSIIKNEIMPAMQRNSNYLAKNNMEITGRNNGIPVIRQKPGGSNSLGRVKFIFPNRYAIYFHDTPAKSLFDRNERAFSHGCIRVNKPFELAKYLLQEKPGWTDERIREEMYSGSEKWVNLDEKVPVYISYFTAWVDDDGQLNFRDDIYGHDKKMATRMFSHSND